MCDSLCVLGSASRDGRSWFAKNSDRPIGEAQRLEWHPPRLDREPVSVTHVTLPPAPEPTLGVLGSRPAWMWGFEHGVNTAGVAIGNERVYTALHPKHRAPALTGMDLVRLGLERASGASAAVDVITDLLTTHGQGGPCLESGEAYWSSFLVADRDHGFVLETSGSEFAVEAFEQGRAISNRLDIADFDARHGVDPTRLDVTVSPRREVTRAAVAAGASLDDLRTVLRSHEGSDGWTVCMHVPGDQVTAAAMIVDLSADPLVAHVAVGSPCRSVFVPIAVGTDPSPLPGWEQFASLGAEPFPNACEARLVAEFDAADPDWPHVAARMLHDALVETGRRGTA